MSKKQRVLQVIHGFNMGGAETLVKDYLLRLKEKGIECKVLCYERYNGPYEALLKKENIPVICLADSIPSCANKNGKIGKILWYVYIYTGFKKTIREWRPDVIHSHLSVNRFIRFAVGSAKLTGLTGNKIQFFHTVHNTPEVLWFPSTTSWREKNKCKLEYKATKYLIKRQGMRLIALHDQMRKELNKLFEVKNTVVVNNGIDFKKFENALPSDEVRSSLGIPHDAFVVGHVGRFSEQKNHKKIISVFTKVKKKNRNAFLLLVGDGELKASVQDEIKRRGLDRSCLILSNRSDIPDLMNAMNVFFFPSFFEGLGIVLIEAQKLGLPCVISGMIPKNAIISNIVRTIGLEEDDDIWADAILSPFSKQIVYDHLEEWDMDNVITHLMRIYNGDE